MDRAFLDNMQTIFIVESINYKNNGITESVMRKIKFIEDAWGYRPILLTANYNAHLSLWEYFFSEGGQSETQTRLNMGTRVFGVFDYFQDCYPYNPSYNILEHPKRGNPDLQYREIVKNVFEVYDDGRLLRREHFTAAGERLQLIEIVDGDFKVSKSFLYDYMGYANKVILWDKEKPGFHPMEFFYSPDQKLRIQAEYRYIEDPEKSAFLSNRIYKDKNELIQYTMFDDGGSVTHVLDSHEKLIALCLDGLTSNPDKAYFICDECALYSGASTLLNKKNVASGVVMHNKFLNNSYDLKSEPQPFYKYVCENRRKFDGIVILTKQETNDFANKYEYSKRLFTIGHPYPFPIQRREFEERDHKRAVTISRLDPFKRLDLMAEIFAEVLKEIPDATLDIYGFGSQQKKLEDRIAELGIGESVRFKGFTNKAAEEMSKAACFLMTSEVEGLPLTLLESVSNGCPVFAFDIKYGPAAIVRDRVTGYLFKDKDKRAYARTLINYFKDMDMQRRMSGNCYDAAPDLGVEAFLEKWLALSRAMYDEIQKRGGV
ncbi:MAG: glycosyltransferase [Clostridiales bacterium]|jgi:poly(glycerol-phosphate) alpha-glucosyltransferase|nr:glycosyltransferase [Clostridiales bacterium]